MIEQSLRQLFCKLIACCARVQYNDISIVDFIDNHASYCPLLIHIL